MLVPTPKGRRFILFLVLIVCQVLVGMMSLRGLRYDEGFAVMRVAVADAALRVLTRDCDALAGIG